MKNGQCVKCGSAAVYTREHGVTYGAGGWGVQADTGGWRVNATLVVSYLCTGCGCFENYIAEPEKLAEVAANDGWKAVPHAAA